MRPKRYHPVLVALHWLLALLLIFALTMGTFGLAVIPNSSPDKIGALQGHMILGALMLVLTVLRLVVRRRTAHRCQRRPESAGNRPVWKCSAFLPFVYFEGLS